MKWNSLKDFGKDALGPIVTFYFTKLHSYLTQCEKKDTKVLFALRAGARIDYAYSEWLKSRGENKPNNISIFKVSRMMSIKSIFAINRELSITAMGKELQNLSTPKIIKCLLKGNPDKKNFQNIDSLPQIPLHSIFLENIPLINNVNDYLTEQSEIYSKYLNKLVGDAKRIIFVDSGWQGTSQLLLENSFRNYEWEGVYFGCMGRKSILHYKPGIMHGLIFDSEIYDKNKPETAFSIHRHLIESLFEPGIKSIEHISNSDLQADTLSYDLLKTEQKTEWDDVFYGVIDYLKENANMPISKMISNYHISMKKMALLLCFPSKINVTFLQGKLRTHDMGKLGGVQTVMPPKNRFAWDTPELRIEQSIWQQGQVSLEFSPKEAHEYQNKLLSSISFDPHQYFTDGNYKTNAKSDHPGHVAIITRTKNRPVMLKRAALSVSAQKFTNYTWVIVNDGGDANEVCNIIKSSSVEPSKIILCSNKHSLGMEAASNVGIRSSSSDYIIIHDDDDSWHPDFLQEAVGFLDNNQKVYGGVITKTEYVSEEIKGNHIVEHSRRPYQNWIQNVQLAEMLVGNFFAPICFLYKRSVGEKIHFYDETLPVLGDWNFNLRFLMFADIGVIHKTLAYYHHRDVGESGNYSNSVIGGKSRHVAYNAIVRNKFIRQNMENNNSALSILMATAYIQEDLRNRISRIGSN